MRATKVAGVRQEEYEVMASSSDFDADTTMVSGAQVGGVRADASSSDFDAGD
ncbi:MAG: hypothetical protein MR294_01570 [Bacteroidales bacterium]|nr:hypothetical protein [Bacteroidales bacterium]MDY2935678.1 hypothetical protein [Candidatus Cryptobacteroides sp.]